MLAIVFYLDITVINNVDYVSKILALDEPWIANTKNNLVFQPLI